MDRKIEEFLKSKGDLTSDFAVLEQAAADMYTKIFSEIHRAKQERMVKELGY